MYRLQELHLKSCEKAKQDPAKLAAHHFELELNSEWDFFSGAAKTYASILGDRGLAVLSAAGRRGLEGIRAFRIEAGTSPEQCQCSA
jgi:hypothetical protein